MKRLIILILIIFCAFNALGAARKALVIGNAAYGGKALKNPVNDATDLAASLQALGFATVLIKDADYAALYRGIESFTEALVSGDEAIFYFSGHGVQIADTNYLIPIGDRKLSDKIDYDTYAISATWALGKLARARVSVMILDACRDNPTLTRSVSAKKGLAKLEPASGSQYVIYATEKDTEAFDGEGRNSPFAASLLKHMHSPVRVGDDLMRLIRSDVRTATAGQQVPTAYGILDDPFYLALPKTEKTGTVPASMIFVEGGSFNMGSNDGESDEKPVHVVSVSSFYIGKYELTQEEWSEVMGTESVIYDDDNIPIEDVTWYEALEYCNKRSLKEGLRPCYVININNRDPNNISQFDGLRWTVSVNWDANGYRLPTEAEWEYAARGGSKSRGYTYSGSNDLASVSWNRKNSHDEIHAVGGKQANELGIFDMTGNLSEWCWDWYGRAYYATSPGSDPKGPGSGFGRVVRGGDYLYKDVYFCRISSRDYNDPDYCTEGGYGFRVVRSAK